MLEILIDTLLDTIKLLPFLFITFLVLELLEHKITDKTKDKLTKSKKIGPFLGGILGIIPQCGFSSMATEFYITRVITLGTLFSVYLSTSDEMLPLFISYNVPISLIIKTLSIKMFIGIFFGFIIDLLFISKEKESIEEFCKNEDCDCEKGLIHSSLKHSINVSIFIFLISLALNFALEAYSIEIIQKIMFKNNYFSVLLSSIIGLIPNCSSSILLTELYLKNIIGFASLISGLLVNSGVGILILFKYNKNMKENFKIVLFLLLISNIVGFIFESLGV